MTRRFTDYDPFAWFYSNYWGEEFHREAVPILEKLLLPLLPPKAAVLDLCCGDGRIMQTLSKRGYRMTGLDGSERMLTYARQRVPKATLLLEDARRFDLPPNFDSVISTFDSLNHVMETTDLAKVFTNVFRCLKPGGHFLFDLNREEAYMDLWARTSTVVDKKTVAVSRGVYDSARKIAVCDVALVRLDHGMWVRSDFQLSQRLHAREDVLSALRDAGFSARIYDATNLGMIGDIGSGRDFYLATK